MKITKSQLKRIIKEEMGSAIFEVDPDGPGDDRAEIEDEASRISQLVDDMDFEHNGFFVALIEEAGKYLSPRKDELEQKMKQAVIDVLLRG